MQAGKTNTNPANVSIKQYFVVGQVEESDLGVRLTLNQLNIPKSTFYDWCCINGSCYVSGVHHSCSWETISSSDPAKDRTVPQDNEEHY
jgi:hypothetical protein